MVKSDLPIWRLYTMVTNKAIFVTLRASYALHSPQTNKFIALVILKLCAAMLTDNTLWIFVCFNFVLLNYFHISKYPLFISHFVPIPLTVPSPYCHILRFLTA